MRITIRQLFVAILFLALFSMAMRPIADPDFWWHLRTGQLIFETRAIPHADPFSFTNQGKTWIAHEWLSEVIIYSIYRIGEYGLLLLIFAAIITGTFLLVYLRSAERPYIAGFALLLGALATAPTWGVRPQILSYLLFALFLFLLDRYAETRKTKTLIPIPILMLLWVNLHAGYALGYALVGIYIAGDVIELIKTKITKTEAPNSPTLKTILILCRVLALCGLAALANPNGIRLLTYPFQTLSSQAMQQNIQEWFSPDFHQIEWQPLAWLIIALVGAGLIGRKSIAPTKVILTLVFGYAALHSMRHVPLFAIAAVPVLAEEIGSVVRIRQEVRQAGRLLKWANSLLLACAILVTGLRFVSVIQEQAETEKEEFPAAAVDWIVQHHPAGNIFDTYGWGGYLIWRLYPEYQVYIDGRADLYGDAFINDYLRVEGGGPGWEASLARDNVRIVLLEPESSLAKELRQSLDWEIAFSDKKSILFIHK